MGNGFWFFLFYVFALPYTLTLLPAVAIVQIASWRFLFFVQNQSDRLISYLLERFPELGVDNIEEL